MSNHPPPTEPSAMHRQGARELRQLFVALINEHFTEQQALAIIGHILAMQGKGEA